MERKSVLDLHSCLVTGRLWTQIGSLRKEARYPFLLVEGGDIDDGPLLPASLRGACLSAMRLGIRFIQTKDQPLDVPIGHAMPAPPRSRAS